MTNEGESYNQAWRETKLQSTNNHRKSHDSNNPLTDNTGASSGRIDGNNQPEENQVCSVNSSIESAPELGEEEYNPEFSGKKVSYKCVAEVLKKNSNTPECISWPAHWLDYFYSSDELVEINARMKLMKNHGVLRKHMHALRCLNSDKLIADSLLNMMKESSLVLANVIDKSGSLHRTLNVEQWSAVVPEKSFRDLFDSPEVKKSIIKCHTTLGSQSSKGIEGDECINYPELLLGEKQIPQILKSHTFVDAFSQLSTGNQANLREAIKDHAAESIEDSDFAYFVRHFTVQQEERDQVWSEHLYAQAVADPKKLQDLIDNVFGRSQNTGFMLSESFADRFLYLLDIHNVEVCPPTIVDRVYSEIDRVLKNDVQALDPYEKKFEEILNVFKLFEFRLKLPGFDTVSAETSTLRFSKLRKTLVEASNHLFSSKLDDTTQSLKYCCKSWVAVDRIYGSSRLTKFQKTKLEKNQLEVMRYALCCMQRLNFSRDTYITIAKEINLGNKKGSQSIDKISARPLIFICLASCAYLPSEQKEALIVDEINCFLKLRFKDVFSSDEFRRCQGESVVVNFRLALQNNVDKAVDQFRVAVSPLTITDEAMNDLIQSVFGLDDQKESYDTLNITQMLDNTTESVIVGLSDDLITSKMTEGCGGIHEGETKSTQPTAEDQGTCQPVVQNHRHDAGVLSQDILDALNPSSIDRRRIDLYRDLIKARLLICGTKRTELVKEIITDLNQPIKNKLHTMEALESLLQRATNKFYFWEGNSKLYQCLCQLLEEVRGCLPFRSGEEKVEVDAHKKERAQPPSSVPAAEPSTSPAESVLINSDLTGMSNVPVPHDRSSSSKTTLFSQSNRDETPMVKQPAKQPSSWALHDKL